MKKKVISYLEYQLDKLKNTNDSYKLLNLNVRCRDLSCIIDLIERYDFVQENTLETDDYLLINPEGDNINGKVFYTEELLKYSIDIITVKIVAEIICYRTGICTFTETKLLSHIYLYLIHISLIDVSIKYYSQSKRGKLYNLIEESDPNVILKYDLSFSKKKLKYYKDFALKHYDSHISFFAVKSKLQFSNGFVLEYDKCLSHITANYGIHFLADITYLKVGIKFNTINIKFNEYKQLMNIYNEVSQDRQIRKEVVDLNFKKITNAKIRNDILTQWKILKTLY